MNILFISILFFFLPVFVFAVTIEDPLGGGTVWGLLDKIIDFLFTIGIPLAVVMILWAALQFLTAAGNPQRIQSAKNTLIWTLVGFAILILAKGIALGICDFFGVTCA